MASRARASCKVLELSAELDGVTVGQFDLFGDFRLRFADEAFHVAAAQS